MRISGKINKCPVKAGLTYEINMKLDRKRGNVSKKNYEALKKYKGKCIYVDNKIAVFDVGDYKRSETINTYKLDWNAFLIK